MQLSRLTTARRIAVASGLLAILGATQMASAEDAADLAKAKKCMTCHKLANKSLGPSFAEVAKKYKGTPNAEGVLATKIKEGSKGVWGTNEMKPQPGLSDEELKSLATWILSNS
jgi:cytochrome c551/c552